MRIASLILIALFCCGCAGNDAHRADSAAIAANMYAAAQAAQEGADLERSMIAVRMSAQKLAVMHGYSIDGAEAWINGLPKEGAK